MSIYVAVYGQTIFDVAIITYGTLDKVVKLANDNGITDLSNTDLSGIEFTYDNALIVNQVLHQQLNQNYGTAQILSGGSDGYYHDGYHDRYFN